MYPAAETLPVRLDDRLMEPQGVAVCNRRIELPLLREAVPAAWNLDGVAELNPYFVLSEGGTISEMKTATFEQRICDFTNMLLREHAGQHVLVVSHHDWIRVWFRLFKEEHVSLENCETRTVTV
jgi:broad specificity phosphatase PhoE